VKKVLTVMGILFISGCAQTTGYKPVVDSYGDPRAMYLQQDMMDCEYLASQNAGVGKNVMTDGLAGGLIGGAAGAAIGAVVGNPGAGAALGAAAGGVGGMAKGGIMGDETYKRIYRNCLRQRGHRPLD
jgi:uncharacterized membrane protein YebE (DUF533 family)